jgi:hypothetical protein
MEVGYARKCQLVSAPAGMLSKKLPSRTLQRSAKPAAFKFSFVRFNDQ